MNSHPRIYVKRRWWLLMVSLLFTIHCSLFTSCEAEAPVSRKYVCRFVFSYRDHSTSLLFAAAQNPGTYVYVTTKGDGKTSVRHVYVNSNDSKTPQEDNVISTDIENYSSYVLGASNSIGLFIGTTNFNGLWAYDRACPNCSSLQAMNWKRAPSSVVMRAHHSCAIIVLSTVPSFAPGTKSISYSFL